MRFHSKTTPDKIKHEEEIKSLLLKAHSPKEISVILDVSRNIINHSLMRIYKKYKVKGYIDFIRQYSVKS